EGDDFSLDSARDAKEDRFRTIGHAYLHEALRQFVHPREKLLDRLPGAQENFRGGGGRRDVRRRAAAEDPDIRRGFSEDRMSRKRFGTESAQEVEKSIDRRCPGPRE